MEVLLNSVSINWGKFNTPANLALGSQRKSYNLPFLKYVTISYRDS